MERQKHKRTSIRWKILIPAAVAVITMGLIMGITAFVSIRSGLVAMGVEEADMAARAATAVIDGDLLPTIAPGCEDSEAYETLLSEMRAIQKKFGIAFLYTLYTDGNAVYYGVDTDESEDQCAPGELFESSYEELAGVFRGETYAQDYIDYTEDGALISVYLPLRDSGGEIRGILGSDYDAAPVVARLRLTVGVTVAIVLLCTLAGLAVVNMVAQGIVKNLKLVNSKVYDLVHSDGDAAQRLDVQTGDELEEIAENVNVVLQNTWAQSNIAREVAEGNLTVEVRPASEKDILGNALARLVRQNSRTLRGIRDAAEQARTGAVQMVTASDTLARSSMEQAGAVEEINAAIRAVAEQTRSNACNSGQATAQIERAIELVNREDSQMQALVAAMNEISQASSNISDILKTIEDIASQTNLLAVNASIEAARAGAAGKGFTVIAQQVRQLAASSAEAASRTSRLVGEAVRKAETGETLAGETAASLRSIIGVVNDCVVMIRDIADASAAQTASITEMDQAISRVAEVVQTNSSISQQCAAASSELSGQMDTVDRMLGIYKLN